MKCTSKVYVSCLTRSVDTTVVHVRTGLSLKLLFYVLMRWQENPDKARIVNQRHFERLQGLLQSHGGQVG